MKVLSGAYNEIAFHGFMKKQEYILAEEFFSKAVEISAVIQENEVEYSNKMLNLLSAQFKAGKNVLKEDIIKNTELLEKNNDFRAEKGHVLLKNLSE